MAVDYNRIRPTAFTAASARRLANDSNLVLDDAQTLNLARQLEYVIAKTFDVEYPDLLALELIPVTNQVPDGANSWLYQQFDQVGAAKLITSYSDDLPIIDAVAEEFELPLLWFGAAYQWSQRDLKRMAMSSVPITDLRARAAREAIARKFDDVAAFGVTGTLMEGFVNNSNVPDISCSNPLLTGTAEQCIAELSRIESTVIANTLGKHSPATLIMPSAHYGRLQFLRAGTTSDKTVLEYFLEKSSTIKEVRKWDKLLTADGGSPRAMAYTKDADLVAFELPNPFEQLPPQYRNLAAVVSCFGVCGGVSFFKPMSALYIDNIGTPA